MKKHKATTVDVLGTKRASKVSSKWQPHYKRLLELRDKLLHRKAELGNAARQEQPTFSLHMADAGTDQYDQDFAFSMMSSEQTALYEIEDALNRIRTGSYGTCQLTGKPIEKARLEAIPWARFSLQAQHELEARGAVARTKLAQPSSISQTSAEGPQSEASDEEEE